MFSSKYNKIVLEALDENIEILEQDNDEESKLLLKVNGKPVSVLEYEIYGNHCCLEFLETYIQENEGKGYATKLVERLKEILKELGIKTISANATTKSQHILKKVFGEPIEKNEAEGYWDDGLGSDIFSVKHQINEAYLVEARSDFILKNQKLVNAVAERYLNNMLSSEELKKWKSAEDVNEQNSKLVQNSILPRLENTDHPYISKYLVWVLRQYALGRWLFPEDIAKLEKELSLFNKLNHTLEKKDINQYKFEEFSNLILDLEGKHTKNEEERLVKSNEAEKVFENANWIMIQPKTKNAAILYGKGTRWCTAATEGMNYFEHYNKQGPLYILISKQDPTEKYQFHWESKQFMNRLDNTITNEEEEKILSDEGLKSFLYNLRKGKLNNTIIDYVYYKLGIDCSERLAKQFKPDENGICHFIFTEENVCDFYDIRSDLDWNIVAQIFTPEGFQDDEWVSGYSDLSDYSINLNKDNYEFINKLLSEYGFPYFTSSQIEKLLNTSSNFVKLFEVVAEEANLLQNINDYEKYGYEQEVQDSIEEQIMNYFNQAGSSNIEYTDNGEVVLTFNVSADSLGVSQNEADYIVLLPKDAEVEYSLAEYMIEYLFDYEKLSIGEPYYGWTGFDDEGFNSYIKDEYIPVLKEYLENSPEIYKEELKEYLSDRDYEKKNSISESFNSISNRKVKFRPNTFGKVAKKLGF